MTPLWILAEETTATWQTFGAAILWIAGVGTALGVIWHVPVVNRPPRWVWRRLASDPIRSWGDRFIGRVVQAQVLSGASSTQIDNMDAGISANHAQGVAREENWETYKKDQAEVLAALANIHDCIDRRFTESNARLSELTSYVEEALTDATGSKERIRQLYRTLDIAVFETDSRGLCTYINPAYTAMTGLTFDQCLGEGWMEAIESSMRDRVNRGWDNATTAMGDFNAIFSLRNVTTGLSTEVRGSAIPLHGGLKQVVGWIGTLDPVNAAGSILRSITPLPEAPNV